MHTNGALQSKDAARSWPLFSIHNLASLALAPFQPKWLRHPVPQFARNAAFSVPSFEHSLCAVMLSCVFQGAADGD